MRRQGHLQRTKERPGRARTSLTNATQQCSKPPCLDTGIIATKWLMELLSLRGRTDIGLDLVFQTDYPSWGFMASMNSTTVWEHWEYMNGPGMNSHNHPALASVGAWLYRWVAGLRLADGSLETPDHKVYGQGFKKLLFAPGCVTDGRLPSVAARLTSLYGPIDAAWAYKRKSLTMTLNLPPNTQGEIVIPISTPTTHWSIVSEAGHIIWQAGNFVPRSSPGVLNGTLQPDGIHFVIGSGNYSFTATA